MYAAQRHLVTALLAALALALASPARAWVETDIQSDAVTVDVARDGSAVVSHSLVVTVHGGPLLGFDLAGVDADADPLPNAGVWPASSGPSSATATPLLVDKKEDGSLHVEINRDRGLRHGNFLFKFQYRTNLLARHLLEADGARVDLTWVGPRYDDGIDTAHVLFRLPAAPMPPRLPSASAGAGLSDAPAGVFFSTLRRVGAHDELDVVRPHIAKGEPVVWRVEVDPRAFNAFAQPRAVAATVAPTLRPALPGTRRRLEWIAAGLLIALAYAMLVALKWRAISRACRARRATPRALVPLGVALRAPLAGSALAGAAGVAVLTEHATLAGLLLVGALGLATHLTPRAAVPLRGPGRWLPLGDEEAFRKSKRKHPGRWLDAGAWSGFLVFALLLAAACAFGLCLLPRSPYQALLVVLGSSCLLPIFCTGRAGELPPDAAREPRTVLLWLAKKLRKDASLKVVAWARIPEGMVEPDELRLLVVPRRRAGGLSAIEVGLEYHHGGGGSIALPCVIVRAADGSDAYRALPRSVVWTRGRKPEERVAVVRPALPTRAACLQLVRRIVQLAGQGAAVHSASRRRSSAGKWSSTAKAATVSSPAHAT
jgi:hypothetical protein